MIARLCKVCKGEGAYEQCYTIGCGMGSAMMMGRCDFCKGVGYVSSIDGKPASAVEVADLLRAASASKTTPPSAEGGNGDH